MIMWLWSCPSSPGTYNGRTCNRAAFDFPLPYCLCLNFCDFLRNNIVGLLMLSLYSTSVITSSFTTTSSIYFSLASTVSPTITGCSSTSTTTTGSLEYLCHLPLSNALLLHLIIFQLLLTSGDIELNPGPKITAGEFSVVLLSFCAT